MNRKLGLGLVLSIALALTACGTGKEEKASPVNAGSPSAAPTASASPSTPPSAAPSASPKAIAYLGKEYTVKVPTDKIVITGALEAMEDAVVLGVKPIGAISIGGKFPAMFKDITASAQSIGEKTQPNLETILKLKPDVILGTSKFGAETIDSLSKIATTIPVSHISTNWEANLLMLGEVTGKKAEAQQAIDTYKKDLAAAKTKIGESVKMKKVVVVRVRSGNLNIYPPDTFLNPSLYTDLGFTVPMQLTEAKAQQIISLEQFSELNPDIIFLQFSEEENADAPKALETLQGNPIWKSLNAVKNNKVFVNIIDPLAQGGTAWSKINFLKAAVDKLAN
ncbi:ABC transporter substrate-binding protein [Paenibacillus koleovorans]|uniref:ABC transporter substrate-binding protein n=1 Tax=Paenibacillus koleovorans TaxID=121608 RepID=UPI000FDC0D30|nr:ABC transporter substrate-binding protein [Paenibacillus koleovorans]